MPIGLEISVGNGVWGLAPNGVWGKAPRCKPLARPAVGVRLPHDCHPERERRISPRSATLISSRQARRRFPPFGGGRIRGRVVCDRSIRPAVPPALRRRGWPWLAAVLPLLPSVVREGEGESPRQRAGGEAAVRLPRHPTPIRQAGRRFLPGLKARAPSPAKCPRAMARAREALL